jgi:hypothetical protein
MHDREASGTPADVLGATVPLLDKPTNIATLAVVTSVTATYVSNIMLRPATALVTGTALASPYTAALLFDVVQTPVSAVDERVTVIAPVST